MSLHHKAHRLAVECGPPSVIGTTVHLYVGCLIECRHVSHGVVPVLNLLVHTMFLMLVGWCNEAAAKVRRTQCTRKPVQTMTVDLDGNVFRA